MRILLRNSVSNASLFLRVSSLIKKDGTLSDRKERFESTDIFLKPVADSEKEKVWGYVFNSDARWEKRNAPYICLELFVPEIEFNKIWEELVSGRLSELEVGVYVDAFESEVDSTLREPDMDKTVYIEEGELNNRVYLSWIRASRSRAAPPGQTSSNQAPESPFELFEAKGFHEEKINYFGKWLMGLGEFVNSIPHLIYKAILFGAVVYLAIKGMAWVFRLPV